MIVRKCLAGGNFTLSYHNAEVNVTAVPIMNAICIINFALKATGKKGKMLIVEAIKCATEKTLLSGEMWTLNHVKA